jgi:hypothetical protein
MWWIVLTVGGVDQWFRARSNRAEAEALAASWVLAGVPARVEYR